MALSGKAGRLVGLSPRTTVGQLASLLGLGPIAVCARDRLPAVVYKGHSERPFRAPAGGPEDWEVDIVALNDDWPNPTKCMRWKDLEMSSYEFENYGLLHAVISLTTDWDGVRTAARVNASCSYVIDGTYVFVELSRNFDVWFAYLGNFTIDGFAADPRSVWLHADIHTALQPVDLGRSFALPTVAAQYTRLHLRFEVDPSALGTGGRPLGVAFDATVAMARAGPRHAICQADHVSAEGRGWALAQGTVAWSSQAPCFLEARVSVLTGESFSALAPQAYEYALEPDDSCARFEELSSKASLDGGRLWHRAGDVYSGLTVAKKKGAPDGPWQFRLVARPIARGEE